MADLSTIELADLIEQHAAIRFGKVQGRNEKATCKGGPCPFCHLGNDRFAVFVNDIPQHFICGIHGNGCGAYGDAITFLSHLYGYSYREACEELDIEVDSKYSSTPKRYEPRDDEPPSEQWQAHAIRFCKSCKETLWSSQWASARSWLQKRGLREKTINTAGIGYNPTSQWIAPEVWGLPPDEGKIWLPRGVVIPWQIDGNLWKVSIRRPDKDIEADRKRYEAEGVKGASPKYVSVAGGSNGLYDAKQIRPGQPLVIAEGEFDKLIFKQEIGNRISCVATGSTGKGREERWQRLIAQASIALIVFDYDSAGHEAYAHYWKSLPNTIRWSPWAHDINEMFLQSIDLNEWIDTGLEVVTLTRTTVLPPHQEVSAITACSLPSVDDEQRDNSALQERIVAFTSRPCVSCGSYDYAFLEDGKLICPCYFSKLEENKKPRPSFTAVSFSEASRGLPDQCCQCKEKPVYFGAGGISYCERHKSESFMDTFCRPRGNRRH